MSVAITSALHYLNAQLCDGSTDQSLFAYGHYDALCPSIHTVVLTLIWS